MNLNMKLDLKSFRFTQAQLRRALPPVVGILLVALFAYTAFTIRAALTAVPNDSQTATTTVATFNKATIASIKALTVVPDQTNITNLGTSSPFSQ
jgi:hypothetical protein